MNVFIFQPFFTRNSKATATTNLEKMPVFKSLAYIIMNSNTALQYSIFEKIHPISFEMIKFLVNVLEP